MKTALRKMKSAAPKVVSARKANSAATMTVLIKKIFAVAAIPAVEMKVVVAAVNVHQKVALAVPRADTARRDLNA